MVPYSEMEGEKAGMGYLEVSRDPGAVNLS